MTPFAAFVNIFWTLCPSVGHEHKFLLSRNAIPAMEVGMPRSRTRKSKTTNVRAVERAIEILEAFSDKPSMSVVELESAIGLNRPTLYRILETLASRGFIRAHGTPQRFSLDYAVGRLAQSWLSGLDPVAAARPILERLHEESKETVGLMMVRNQQSMCILELPSPHALAMSRGIGPMGHLARGASGKAILAHMDANTLDAVLRTLPKDIDKKRLLDELAKVRRDGFRVSRAEVFAGAVAIAAPFFDHTRRVCGSIAVYGPDARVTEDWVTRMTKRIAAGAAELSTALGYNLSSSPAAGTMSLIETH
jgi:IclR family transcriptional regulator, acetate operon repressor